MQTHPYFTNDKVIVLAHRGGTLPTENTIEAFQIALQAGADVLETDIQATKDGIAVLFHDESLERLNGLKQSVSQLEWPELAQLKFSKGSSIPTLRQALTEFPNAKFNIDIKAEAAVPDLISTIEELKAHDRVLVSSFSNRRRLLALSQFSKPVATSASASIVIRVWFYSLIGLPTSALSKALEGIGALQIPRRMSFIRLDSPKFIKKILNTGTQLHFWTINDPRDILELASQGASGIVTDVPELAVQTLRKA